MANATMFAQVLDNAMKRGSVTQDHFIFLKVTSASEMVAYMPSFRGTDPAVDEVLAMHNELVAANAKCTGCVWPPDEARGTKYLRSIIMHAQYAELKHEDFVLFATPKDAPPLTREEAASLGDGDEPPA